MAEFTKKFHRTTYPRISPTNPSNDQKGRTVLITGGSQGIGFNIARAYAEAQAEAIILVSRSPAKLDEAVQTLQHAFSQTKISSIPCDISDGTDIKELWRKLAEQHAFVDVLVSNASARDNNNTEDIEEIISCFQMNVFGALHMLQGFRSQSNPDSRQQIFINVTSAALQMYPYGRAGYASSKSGFANYLCHIADQVPQEKLRLINLHPGSVFTPAAATSRAVVTADMPIWDHESLSAHTAVWVGSEEAAFLHGRYLWCNWDADELVTMKQKVLDDPGFLKVGITGMDSVIMSQWMEVMARVPAPKNKEYQSWKATDH